MATRRKHARSHGASTQGAGDTPLARPNRVDRALEDVGAGAFVIKYSATRPDSASSRQITSEDDPFAGLIDRVLPPPLDPERLWMLFEECSPHAACINAKATDAVGQGWKLETEDPEEPADEITGEPGSEGQGGGAPAPEADPDSPAHQEVAQRLAERTRELSDLLEELTPRLTWTEMLIQAAREEDAIGWAAWEVVREDAGPLTPKSKLPNIAALYPIPAHTLRVGADKKHETFIQVRGGKRVWFKAFGSRKNINCETGKEVSGAEAEEAAAKGKLASEVLMFRGYSPRTQYYGVPTWLAGTPAAAELAAIRDYNINWFASGGTADRSIHVTAQAESVAKTVAESIQKQLTEAAGTGHVTIITYGTSDVTVTAAELTPNVTGRRDGQFRERRTDLVKELLVAHQVPPYRIGWAELGSLGGSAAKEMLRAYRQGAIEPKQLLLEDRLNQTLFGPDGLNLGNVKFKLNELTWDVLEMNIELATKGVEKGILSPNDGREVIGQPRVDKEGMDEHYFAGKKVGEAPEPPPQPGVPGQPGQPGQPGGESAEEMLRAFTDALVEARKDEDVPQLQ